MVKIEQGDFMKKAIRIFDAVFAAFCAVLFTVIGIASVMLPDNIITYDGEEIPFSSGFSYTGKSEVSLVDSQTAFPRQRSLKLFGVFPVKDVTVTDKPSQEVMVSGEIFGIKLYTDGVIVVATQDILADGKKINPAKEAGIEVGDIIVEINGTKVYTSDDVEGILNDNNGRDYVIKVKRGDRFRTFSLTPVYASREGCYKAGMWVRDSTAGIGTITFYNEKTGMFAALGHQINDVDTNEIMPLLEGEAVNAVVTSVQKGGARTAGSLCCDFSDVAIGELYENSECGIYGAYYKIFENARAYPVAAKQEVKKGKATLISTVEAGEPKEYEIEITHINYLQDNYQKNMSVKITDEELISKTGGIVQGMSGSPIVQNGKIIGALTHVIVDNQKKGYAIFAQTMLEKS